ncbi:MAG: ABC transporter permease subunit, partial [Treponema sp.]|nr:ABC transporter permease subunit [Treponema sp.]
MDGNRKISLGNLRRDKLLIMMILPVVVYYILFSYLPMYGVVIAFKDYRPGRGIWGSRWVGLEHFKQFFGGFFFVRLLRNTLLISVYSLVWGFPVPIIFALILNEFKDGVFKRSIQTITYLPHFISVVVICGMIVNFLSPANGIVNIVLEKLIGKRIGFLNESGWFRGIYVGSGIWQGFGWNSIIYLAALSGIDMNLYEAAKIDGAGRLRQIRHISLPGIMPTVVTLFILSVGNLMSVGFEKIILLSNPAIYETADVISTYVYRMGIQST